MRCYCLCLLLLTGLLPAAERRGIFPPGVKTAGPYSPGVAAGDYLYVSGQGAKQADGKFPENPAAQLRQCLENIKTIVQLAGFSMDGIVYSIVYVRDPAAIAEVETAWQTLFPRNGPARSILGVARLPEDTPVEVNAVVIRKPSRKRIISLPGSGTIPDAVLTPDRAYLSDCRGSGDNAVQTALERMGADHKAAGLDHRHMIFVNPFLTDTIKYEPMNQVYAKYFEFGDTPARATINANALPGGASIEFTGVAVLDLKQRHAVRPKNMPPSPTASPCVFGGDTFYCSAKSGFIPGPQTGIYAGTVETQVRQTMRNLLDGLEEAGLSLENVVAANVYLDDIADFPKMNRIYKLFFGDTPPARTTVQNHVSVEHKANEREQWPTLEQISFIAVKP